MKVFKRVLRMLIFIFIFSLLSNSSVSANVPYDSYTYNYWLDPVLSPNPFVPKEELTGKQLGVGEFKEPSDLFLSDDGYIYIADTGNNRIIWFDLDFNFIDEIETFNNGDTFNQPRGVFVSTEDKHLFVADTENQRVVEFDNNGEFVRNINRPETNLITDKTSFRPTKVAVDKAGRIYTLAIGINSGIVEINPDGTFQGFLGASEVSINPITYVWRRYFATEEQLERMQLIIPTEYNNIFLDNEDFIYVTMGNVGIGDRQNKEVIRRLNPTGINVIRDFGYGPPVGDYFTRDVDSITRFNDITVTDYQVYTALDSVNGKLFSYDYDGNLLYVFGRNGYRKGNFNNAVALDQYEDTFYVLDRGKEMIITFEMTKYGKAINDAIRLTYEGKYNESTEKWEEVLIHNANSDLAYIGLGKVYLRSGEYKQAMDYFKLAHNRKYYSKAFEYYRRDFLNENFGTIMTTLLLIITGLIIGWIFWKKVKRSPKGEAVYENV